MTTTQDPQTSRTTADSTSSPVVIIGGAGKTGGRVADRLEARGVPTRFASRSTSPAFDWEDATTWRGALEGARAAYLAYQPDLAAPGAAERIGEIAALASTLGVERLVLLSGRGEEGAIASERAAFAAHDGVTVCRVAWFAQNFTEGALAGAVPSGVFVLPAPGDVPEPFVDLDDVADVAVLALTEDGHGGVVHELTGPESVTLDEVALQLAEVSGRPVEYVQVTQDEFTQKAVDAGLDQPTAAFLAGLFSEIFDGRNVATTTGVRDALGREPRAFGEWAKDAAAQGVWSTET
ncbi:MULTISPECIES: NmrA family transcriptional regulator [unclassified Knoellia]|uniref:NmrA family transcriptional regulator n=1 Tax=Knoellia altitudinis TaxID=3404795 RepID=UPI0036072C6D